MKIQCFRYRKTIRRCSVLLTLLLCISARAELDPSIPVIAGPVDFSVILIDESTVEFSWNPELLDGSEVSYFKIRDDNVLLGETAENRWRLSGIDRNIRYSFTVSAITASGEETRRSNRVDYDLPQLSLNTPDGFNAYLPPLENLQAEIIDATTVQLSWSPARAHWSWADLSDYRYSISVGGSQIEVVESTSYVLSGLSYQGLVWISVNTRVPDPIGSGPVLLGSEPTGAFVDTTAAPGTVTKGYPGYSSLFGLRAEVYSKTAAELFWEAPSFPRSSYVYINGRLVERLQDGYSLFIDNFTPGERTLVSVGQAYPYPDPQPPYEWLQYYDDILMHTWIETVPADPENPDNLDSPEPVTGLRYDIYSRTSAEIFWDRSDVVPVLYRIYVNGEFLTETDGVSWYFNNLTSGSEVRVGVAAVVFWDRDSAGTRYDLWLDGALVSNTDATSWYSSSYEPGSSHRLSVKNADPSCQADESIVEFTLKGDTSTPSPPSQSDAPSKPGQLRADVYSRTAAELFWLPSSDDGWVVGYDIFRDGVKVAEKRDVKSYFDNTLSAGQRYVYTVVAIDNEGNRSEQASVELITRGDTTTPQPTPVLNSENYADIVPYILTLYTGVNYREPFYNIEHFFNANTPETETYVNPQNTNVVKATYLCTEGGTAAVTRWSGGAAARHRDFIFEDCAWDSNTYDGAYVFDTQDYGNTNYTMQNYRVSNADGKDILVNGTVSRSSSCKICSYTDWKATLAEYRSANDNGATVLTDVDTIFGYGATSAGQTDEVAKLSGSQKIRSPATGNQTLSVSTPVEFLNETSSERVFSKGKLLISAEDGSSIEINADTGNDATVTLIINTAEGLDTQGEVIWDQWRSVLSFETN